MSNNIDSEIIACAKVIHAATNHETEVTVARRVTISRIQPEPKLYFEIFFGDILNKSQWKWECAHADTLAEVQATALDVMPMSYAMTFGSSPARIFARTTGTQGDCGRLIWWPPRA